MKSTLFCRRTLLFLLALVLISLAGSTSAQTPAESRITAEAIVALQQVDQVALDGASGSVAYALRVPRSEADDPGPAWRHLWVVDADGNNRRYTSGKERISSPSWSNDGKTIYFLAKRKPISEFTQLFAIHRAGGEANAVTDHGASIGSYSWSPDGKLLAFNSSPAVSDEEKERKKKGWDQQVDLDLKPRQLWLLDTTTGESRVLVEERSVWSFTWTPDSESLVIHVSEGFTLDDDAMNRQIELLPLNGAPRLLVETPGKLGAMEVSPDGSQLAFLGATSRNDPLPQSLFVAPLAGNKATNLMPRFEATAIDLAWIDDDRVLMQAIAGERHRLYEVPTEGGPIETTWPGRAIARGLDFDRATGKFAAAVNTPEHPSEVFTAKIGYEPRRLTDHNPELAEITLAQQETIEWTATDGITIGGVLTLPLDYVQGQRYPLLLQIHGGPEGSSLDGWRTRSTYPAQLLAADGFVVLEPNYRGSGGRGVQFSKGDHDDLGGVEFDDVLAGIDHLAEIGLIDPDRVGTGGWSYGGFFSAWAATRHTERFKAAMVGAGLTNWLSFANTTDIPTEMGLVHWNNFWFNEPELHWQRSPLAWINQANTPTLVVQGARDARVHPEQSLQFYNALHLKGVPTSQVVYPREPHGITERAHELDYMERVLGWFNRYVKGESD